MMVNYVIVASFYVANMSYNAIRENFRIYSSEYYDQCVPSSVAQLEER